MAILSWETLVGLQPGGWVFLTHPRDPGTQPLSKEVNVGCVWIGFVLCMICAHYLRGPYAYAGICNWGMCIVNALGGHLLPWVLMGYNPGPALVEQWEG